MPIFHQHWVWIKRKQFDFDTVDLIDEDGCFRVGIEVLKELFEDGLDRSRRGRGGEEGGVEL